MSTFCTTTGLKVVSKFEWSNQKVSETLEANYSVIGDSIIYSRPKGFADLNGVIKSLKINNKVAKNVTGGKGSYIQIEDYSLIKGASIEARKYVAKKMNDDLRRKSIIFCNTSLALSIAIKFGNRFVNTNKNIHTVKSYIYAIKLAIKISQTEQRNLKSNMLDIFRSLAKDRHSLSTVKIFSEESWNIKTEGYSCNSFVIDGCILHSTNSGYFQAEHIPLVYQMLTKCYNALSKEDFIKYNVVECSQFKGVHPFARIKHMNAMKKWHKQYPIKIFIVYNANTSMKTAFYIAKALMPFKIIIANDIHHVFQIINADRNKKLSKPQTTKKNPPKSLIAQKDIEKLTVLIGSILWEESFEKGINSSDTINEEHPFYSLYKSIKLIKEEIDEIFTEQKKAVKKREKLIKKLKNTLENNKTLRGFLPICASCKKIRDDKGYWNQIESYIKKHSEAEFSHGICPDCAKRLYPDFVDENGKISNGPK